MTYQDNIFSDPDENVYTIYSSFLESDAKEMYRWLFDIEKENDRRKRKYPSLGQIDIQSLRHRIAQYLNLRDEANKDIATLEAELERPLTLAEAGRIDGPLNRMRKSLRNALMYGSTGFEGGMSQACSVGAEYEQFVNELYGNPVGYDALVERMSLLSRREQRELIDNLLYKDKIDGYQHMELVSRFIDSQPWFAVDSTDKGSFDMGEMINPAYCPFRSSLQTSDGQPICAFCDEESDEDPSEDEYDDEVDEKEDERESSDSYETDQSVSDYDAESDEASEPDISYEYTVDGESVDVSDASDTDVSSNDSGADFDGGDYDGGDYDGGDYGDGDFGGGDYGGGSDGD